MPPQKYNEYKPILYSLKQRFGNPLQKGIFALTNSSQNSYYDDRLIENILEWDSKSGWESANIEDQYFIIDFKENVVSINGYGLRPFFRDHVPLEWKIFGSNGNDQWVEVDHKTENPCNGSMGFRDASYPNAKFCMKFLEKYYSTDNPGYYHMIKIQQIGSNSGSQYQPLPPDSKAFYIYAFEIYGDFKIPINSMITPKFGCKWFKLSYLIYSLFMCK